MSDCVQRVTHGIRRGGVDLSPRAILVLSGAFLTLAFLAALYLGLVSQAAARGRHIEQLRAELIHLQRENEQLEVDVARAGSVSRLWERAAERGFVPAERVEYLSPVGGE
jgi:hypothetical protein